MFKDWTDVSEVRRLPRGSQDTQPQWTVDVEVFAAARDGAQRYMRKLFVRVTNHHVGFAGHGCVYSVLSEAGAENRVIG